MLQFWQPHCLTLTIFPLHGPRDSVLTSNQGYFPSICDVSCASTVQRFILSCFPASISKDVYGFINAMCSVNPDNVPCYKVTSLITYTPDACYSNIQDTGTDTQCTQGCRRNLLRFSLDAGCCAQTVYNTDYLPYLYYMDSDIWNHAVWRVATHFGLLHKHRYSIAHTNGDNELGHS